MYRYTGDPAIPSDTAGRRGCLESETLSVVRVPDIAGAVVHFIRDYRGQYLRLTDERLEHIVRQHPEAARLGMLAIEGALRHPDAPVQTWVTSSSVLS